jgi:diguanylate cyclase (GGDEF)-like protein
LADIDHFKKVNDTMGHLFGDEALKEVARRLRSNLRVYDGVGRYGGEEFLMVLADCDLMAALLKADDLRSCVGSEPIVSSGASKNITVSMGVAVSTDHPNGDIGLLLRQADRGLYAAKQNGRNRVQHVDQCGMAQQTSDLTAHRRYSKDVDTEPQQSLMRLLDLGRTTL